MLLYAVNKYKRLTKKKEQYKGYMLRYSIFLKCLSQVRCKSFLESSQQTIHVSNLVAF